MTRDIILQGAKTSDSKEGDPLARDVRRMAEQGVVAQTEASSLKFKVIQLTQRLSSELELFDEGASDFFLDVCDMMMTGDLSRMHPDAFKVYLVMMAYRDVPGKNPLNDMKTLHEITGIAEPASLSNALEKLRKDGHIDSDGKLVSYADKRSRRKPEGRR